MGWKVGLYNVGVDGNGGAEGPDHEVWLTSLAFFSSSIRSSVLFSLGISWLYGPTLCRGNGRKTFSVHSKVHDLFRDRDHDLSPYALNDYGPGC